MRLFILLLGIVLLTHCVPNREDSASPDDLPAAVMNEAVPLPDQVDKRVTAARERLNASEAGQRIGQAIEAHGGLARWYGNGPLAFRFNYQPLDDGTPRDTYEVASYWSAQTRHRLAQDTTLQYGWDGQQAWAYPTDTLIPYDVRFWSLTPYYFVGIPFVLADEGIDLALMEPDTLAGNTYDLVKVTFGAGVGDAPDDYYVIYIAQDDNRVDAIRYIVSYPGYFPKGGHAPEKLMTYEGAQTADGITLPERYRTFWWKDEQRGEHITNVTLSEVTFRPDVSADYFAAPAEAVRIEDI
ncbi:MAG: hypothetical protein WA960_00275 [Tunicatimonas sp.]